MQMITVKKKQTWFQYGGSSFGLGMAILRQSMVYLLKKKLPVVILGSYHHIRSCFTCRLADKHHIRFCFIGLEVHVILSPVS